SPYDLQIIMANPLPNNGVNLPEDEQEPEEDPEMEKEEEEEEDMDRKVKGLAKQMFDRANTEYLTLKRVGEMDRYLSGLSTERRSEVREHYKLKQSEEKERLKKKLRASQQEKDQIEQAFR
nr:hypothetical protein [Tanacetum cinerariifolium]